VQNKVMFFDNIYDDGRQVMAHNRVDSAIIGHIGTFTMFLLYPGSLWFVKRTFGNQLSKFSFHMPFILFICSN